MIQFDAQNSTNLNMDVSTSDTEITTEIKNIYSHASDDYEKLNNLPSLDGRKIIGNIKELDPTVPNWAKQESKPTYTASEVGAVDDENALSLSEIDEIFNGLFNE